MQRASLPCSSRLFEHSECRDATPGRAHWVSRAQPRPPQCGSPRAVSPAIPAPLRRRAVRKFQPRAARHEASRLRHCSTRVSHIAESRANTWLPRSPHWSCHRSAAADSCMWVQAAEASKAAVAAKPVKKKLQKLLLGTAVIVHAEFSAVSEPGGVRLFRGCPERRLGGANQRGVQGAKLW